MLINLIQPLPPPPYLYIFNHFDMSVFEQLKQICMPAHCIFFEFKKEVIRQTD
jgi:hypothetical protein